jgi:hypothetical protein
MPTAFSWIDGKGLLEGGHSLVNSPSALERQARIVTEFGLTGANPDRAADQLNGFSAASFLMRRNAEIVDRCDMLGHSREDLDVERHGLPQLPRLMISQRQFERLLDRGLSHLLNMLIRADRANHKSTRNCR